MVMEDRNWKMDAVGSNFSAPISITNLRFPATIFSSKFFDAME